MKRNILKNSFFVLINTVFCASIFFSSINTAFAFTDQTITVDTPAPISAVYGDSFSVSATASSGLLVQITTVGGCSVVNGEIVTMTSGITSCDVHYNQAGNESFNPAIEVVETTTATKRPITIIAVTNTKEYDGGKSATGAIPIITSGTIASIDYETIIERYNNADVGIGKTITPAVVVRRTGTNAIVTSNYDFGVNNINLVPVMTGVINKITPMITWNTPADITSGTPLNATQQNATASVPGIFVYTEAPGIILSPGSAQILSVNFTPNDVDHYNNVVGANVLINVIHNSGGSGLIASSATPAVPGVSSAIPAIPAVPASKVLGASTGPISGCDNRTTGFSIVSGQSCATNSVGQVLGAEKFVFTKLMRQGSRGDEVIGLQNFLNAAGYNCGTADGKFGPKSKAALIKFQIANGLKGDGIAGPLTHAVLNK